MRADRPRRSASGRNACAWRRTGLLKGRVTAVEHLGSETLIYAEVAGSNVVAKTVEDLTVAVDDAVAFAFSDADYHLFDAEGLALKSLPDVPAQ